VESRLNIEISSENGEKKGVFKKVVMFLFFL